MCFCPHPLVKMVLVVNVLSKIHEISISSGDVHVADQSTTSIVLAWTEPLVVGAAGLRGGLGSE